MNHSLSSWKHIRSQASDDEQFMTNMSHIRQGLILGKTTEEINALKQKKFGLMQGVD